MLIAASRSSLSDFPWPGFLLLATFILMVAIFRRVRRARAGAIGKVARNLGLEPMPDASVLDLPLDALHPAGERRVENVLRGNARGVELIGFDLLLGSDGPGGFSCVATSIRAHCPHLVVDGRDAAERLLIFPRELETMPEQRFEWEDFETRYTVRCVDARFAHAFLEPRLMEALSAASSHAPLLEVRGTHALFARYGLVKPAELPGFLDQAATVFERIPRVILELYPLE